MDESKRKRIIIRDKLNQIQERINIVASSAGRNTDDIRLVVVTKTQPVEVIQYVIDAGAADLGENYVEDAIQKIQAIVVNKPIRWHMIGHVQSRKAQSVCQYFQYLHSLDSVKLAERLSRFADLFDKALPVWIEFNVGGEESKYGWNIQAEGNWDKILPDIEKVLAMPKLDILGVMTVPPYSKNPEASRPYFKQLRKFQEFVINHLHVSDFKELSMGMSSDFEVAIQEGSTCVRIGQAIFGPRSV